MKIDGKEISKELLAKAMACETAEELVALAKENGVEITNEQAQAYLAESENYELDEKQLEKVAGGDFGPIPWRCERMGCGYDTCAVD